MGAARRLKLGSFLALLAILTLVYVTTGPSHTHNSDFYKKTLALIEAKVHAADTASLLSAQRAEHQQHNPQDESDTLRSRLKDAEKAAKKSADDRYRALRDVEQVIKQNREAASVEAKEEKGVAGRKMMPEEPLAAPLTSLPTSSSLAITATKEPIQVTHAGKQAVLQAQHDAQQPQLRAVDEDMAAILKRAPMVIFSKSYCPHSKKAKRVLLQAYTIEPAPYVIELDQHPKGALLQELLQQMTGRRTVPNILINGKSMGGGDETERLWKSGELPVTIKQMAGKKVDKVTENFGWVGEGADQRPVLRKG